MIHYKVGFLDNLMGTHGFWIKVTSKKWIRVNTRFINQESEYDLP